MRDPMFALFGEAMRLKGSLPFGHVGERDIVWALGSVGFPNAGMDGLSVHAVSRLAGVRMH